MPAAWVIQGLCRWWSGAVSSAGYGRLLCIAVLAHTAGRSTSPGQTSSAADQASRARSGISMVWPAEHDSRRPACSVPYAGSRLESKTGQPARSFPGTAKQEAAIATLLRIPTGARLQVTPAPSPPPAQDGRSNDASTPSRRQGRSRRRRRHGSLRCSARQQAGPKRRVRPTPDLKHGSLRASIGGARHRPITQSRRAPSSAAMCAPAPARPAIGRRAVSPGISGAPAPAGGGGLAMR